MTVKVAGDTRWARCPECKEDTAQTRKEQLPAGAKEAWVCECGNEVIVLEYRPPALTR